MDDQNEIANAGDERVCAYEDGRMIWRSDAVAGDSSGSGIDVTDRFVLGESSDSRFLEWLVWTFASATPVFSVAAWITIAFRRRQPRLAYDAAIAALWPAAGFLILLVLVMVGSFVTAMFFINLDEDYLAYRQETEQLVEYHDAYDWDGTPEQLGEVEALEVAFTQMNQSGLHLFEWLGRFTVVILMLIWPVMWIASIVHAQRQWFCDFGQENESDQPERLLISAFGLWAILGWLGAHRFYLGRWVSGLLYLFSLGGFGIGWAVDIFTLRSAVDQKNAVSESTHELAPWASDTRFGLFDFVCRWAFFVIGPSVFVVLCVIFSQAELLFVMLFTLVVCGLFGNMQQTIERLNKLERIPLVRSAVLVIKQLHDFYYENQPRSFWFYLLGPITLPIAWIRSAAFRKETSLYLRFFVTILGAVLINQVRLIPTTYRYHSFSSILIWVVVQIAAALLISWVILTPILTTTYTFNLSGRRRRLRVLSLSALCVACSTGLVAGAITFVNHEPSFVSFTLISTRLNDSAFQERLSHSSRLFLEHYVDRIPKPLDDFYPMASHPELTKRYQDEVLSTLTKRDEAKVFRVFTMDVEGDDPDGAWVGVGMLLAEDQDDEWRTLFAMGPDHKFYSTWDKTLPPRVADDFESASALWNSQYEHRIARRSPRQDLTLYDNAERFLRKHKQRMIEDPKLWEVEATTLTSGGHAIASRQTVFDPKATHGLRRELAPTWGDDALQFRVFLISPSGKDGWWLGVAEGKNPLCILAPWGDYFRAWDRDVYAGFQVVTAQMAELGESCATPTTRELVEDFRFERARRFLIQYVDVSIDEGELSRRANDYLRDESDVKSRHWHVQELPGDTHRWLLVLDGERPEYLLGGERTVFARQGDSLLNLASQPPPPTVLAWMNDRNAEHVARQPRNSHRE